MFMERFLAENDKLLGDSCTAMELYKKFRFLKCLNLSEEVLENDILGENCEFFRYFGDFTNLKNPVHF